MSDDLQLVAELQRSKDVSEPHDEKASAKSTPAPTVVEDVVTVEKIETLGAPVEDGPPDGGLAAWLVVVGVSLESV